MSNDAQQIILDNKNQMLTECSLRQEQAFQQHFGTMVRILNRMIAKKNKHQQMHIEPIQTYNHLQLFILNNQQTIHQDIRLLGRLAIRSKLRIAHKLENFAEKKAQYEQIINDINEYRETQVSHFDRLAKEEQMKHDPLGYLTQNINPMFANINIPGRVKLDDINNKIDAFAAIIDQVAPENATPEMIDGLEAYFRQNEYSLMMQFDENSMEYMTRHKLHNILRNALQKLGKNLEQHLEESMVDSNDDSHTSDNINDRMENSIDSESDGIAQSTLDIIIPEKLSLNKGPSKHIQDMMMLFSDQANRSRQFIRNNSLQSIARSEDFGTVRNRWATKY